MRRKGWPSAVGSVTSSPGGQPPDRTRPRRLRLAVCRFVQRAAVERVLARRGRRSAPRRLPRDSTCTRRLPESPRWRAAGIRHRTPRALRDRRPLLVARDVRAAGTPTAGTWHRATRSPDGPYARRSSLVPNDGPRQRRLSLLRNERLQAIWADSSVRPPLKISISRPATRSVCPRPATTTGRSGHRQLGRSAMPG